MPLTQALRAADGAGPVQVGAHLARPLSGAFGGLVGQLHPGPGARVRADKQTGATLRGAPDRRRWVPGRVQGRGDLVGLLCDDGAAGLLGTAHGALDGGRPVLVGAVLTRPLDGRLAHPRSGAPRSFLPPTGRRSHW